MGDTSADAAEVQRVDVRPAVDVVAKARTDQEECIVAVAAVDRIDARTTIDRVVAVATVDDVDAVAAGDGVVAAIAVQRVGIAVAGDGVIAGAAVMFSMLTTVSSAMPSTNTVDTIAPSRTTVTPNVLSL